MSDPRLEEWLAKQDCIELIYSLARAIDRCDAGLIAACYHGDATDDHGMIKGTIQEFIAAVIPTLQRMKRTQHNVTNILVKVNGDRARGEAYFIAQHTIAPDGKEVEMFAAGRYLDRFERRGGVWKIAHRHAVYDWTMTVPASGGWDGPPMQALLQRGERGTGDASYAHFDFRVMAKIIGFIRRRDDLDFAAFSRHWRTVHRDHALKLDRWLHGYVQNHLRPGPIADMQRPADGCPTLWVDRVDDMAELAASEAFRTGAYLDEPLFMEGRSSGLPVDERVVIAPDPAATVKAMLFLGLRDGAESVIDAPNACGRVSNVAIAREGLDPAYAFDVVEELWWRDGAAYEADRAALAALGDAPWLDRARSKAALVDELVVISPR